jgi:RNA-directed DNA polymerase
MSPSPPQHSDEEIAELLRQAVTSGDLAALVGVSKSQLTRLAYRLPTRAKYTTFQIPKRGGGFREIAAPGQQLRYVQRRLAKILLVLQSPHAKPSVHGFTPDKCVRTNAARHQKRAWVLNIDIEAFFPSINFGRVLGSLLATPFELKPAIARLIANLSCYDGVLPQGAPTSPILSNIVCMRLDRDLIRLAHATHARVTRYADDITFSTKEAHFPSELAAVKAVNGTLQSLVGADLEKVITNNGFTVNASKVRLQSRHYRQEVTGLVVNAGVNVHRKYVRQLRAMLHAWDRYGLTLAQQEHNQRYRSSASGGSRVSFRRVVAGKLAYLAMIKGPGDAVYRSLRARYEVLAKSTDHDAVWVVESSTVQGTGFFLYKIGFVTCLHVVGNDDYVEVFRPDAPEHRFRVSVAFSHPDPDLAICLHHEHAPFHSLKQSKEPVKVMQSVRLLGYPDWSVGASIAEFRGNISQTRLHFGHPCAVVDIPIVHGNSGGPLLDTEGRVLGIAIKGTPDPGEPNHKSRAILLSAIPYVVANGRQRFQMATANARVSVRDMLLEWFALRPLRGRFKGLSRWIRALWRE